ncbi:hypothetical protein CSA37_06590 [Candidatus Fermentibacteria bacterium]|nr:MAG: hypothetical protein CSA37_06590 [Candidatus Fermentibacteria bacterium]
MRGMALFGIVLLFSVSAFSNDARSEAMIRTEVQLFMEALKNGDGVSAAMHFSSEAMVQVNAMLNSVKQSFERDPESTLRRLSNAGYTVDTEVLEDWQVADYLAETLSLPMISARYAPYELNIISVSIDGRSAVVDMIFRTAAGAEIPQEALLDYENDLWKISSFMGITAFP